MPLAVLTGPGHVRIPTTMRSRSISSVRVPYSHVSSKVYRVVIYCLMDSPSNWFLLLNRALSKMSFRRTSNSSNLVTTVSYLFLSSSVTFVDVSTPSASWPMQESSSLTLTWFACLRQAAELIKPLFPAWPIVGLLEIEWLRWFETNACHLLSPCGVSGIFIVPSTQRNPTRDHYTDSALATRHELFTTPALTLQ